MRVAIYNTETGLITRYAEVPASLAANQCDEGEEFYLNCPRGVTHIIDGEPVTRPQPDAVLLSRIRERRNRALMACDWTQMPDVPLTPELKEAWVVYRQALRDFPANCDIQNPQWPIPPN